MVSGIKKVVQGFGVLCLLTLGALGDADPVREYVKNLTPLGGDNHFYADDRLLRLDADIDGDGVNEAFITMGRDRNGKQGNAWSIYTIGKDRVDLIGGATFNEGGIYVGRVEEINAHGILSFWSSGGGEGQIMVTTLKKGRMSERSIGVVERDRNTGELKGRGLVDKYFRLANKGVGLHAREIRGEELQQKYGLKVERETYSQALSRGSAETEALRAAEVLAKAAASGLPKMEESIVVEASPKQVVAPPAPGAVIAQAEPVRAEPAEATPPAVPGSTVAPAPATAEATRRRNILISLVLILVLTTGHLFYKVRRR